MSDQQDPIVVAAAAARVAILGTALALATAALLTICGGCAPVGGTARHRPAPVEPDNGGDTHRDQQGPVVPQEFRSDTAKRVDKAFADYRAGMARGWREAAAQQPPAQSWEEAYSRVKRNNFAEREKAFAPFAQDLDRLTQGKEFTPELFREIAETVAKELEQ
jgi:hypothetical protein